MAFAIRQSRMLAALLAVAATALMVWFGRSLDPWWPLAWVAPLPVLSLATRYTWRSAAVMALLSWVIGYCTLFRYFRELGSPFAAWLATAAGMALIFTLAVLLFQALVRRGAYWSALFGFPALWVASEYITNLTSIHATAANLAYTQLRLLPLLQLASVTGPWGISFVVMLFSPAVVLALHLRKTGRNAAPRLALRIAGTALGLIAAVVIFGAVRLAGNRNQPEIAVGLIASDQPDFANLPSGAAKDRMYERYAVQARALAAWGARVIVLPEKLGIVPDSEGGKLDAVFQPIADETSATIVLGEQHLFASSKYNRARIYRPNAPPADYDKHHMLPPFESRLTPGTTMTVLHGKFLPRAHEPWGIEICKDMDFLPLSRDYGKAGAALMLVPAWDFNMDRTWHGHMAIMRGVEDGFSIVRAAKNGYLTVSDSRGRVLAEARSDSAPFTTILANVPAEHVETIYLRFGDWFAWLSIAILCAEVVQLTRKLPARRAQQDAMASE